MQVYAFDLVPWPHLEKASYVMSAGRIISGFVRGVPQEYLALSVPQSQARERLNEAWDFIVKAWTTRENIMAWARGFEEAGGKVVQEIYAPLETVDFAPYVAQLRRDVDRWRSPHRLSLDDRRRGHRETHQHHDGAPPGC